MTRLATFTLCCCGQGGDPQLERAVPQIKKNVLNACAQTVAPDGVIQEMEAELLRAIADTLDCPIPPLIPVQAEDATGQHDSPES